MRLFREPIAKITAILVAGFFLSRLVFVQLGGDANNQDFIGVEGFAALAVVMAAFFLSLWVAIQDRKGGQDKS